MTQPVANRPKGYGSRDESSSAHWSWLLSGTADLIHSNSLGPYLSGASLRSSALKCGSVLAEK